MKALTALFAIMALGFFIAGPMPLVTLGSAAKASAPIASSQVTEKQLRSFSIHYCSAQRVLRHGEP
jgi:hypothetical protein